MRTSGNGPVAVRIPDAAVDRELARSKPQSFSRDLATAGSIETNGDTSTVFVLIVTESRNSARRLSVPLP